MDKPNPLLIEYAGGCHCGRVRFAVSAPAEIEAFECNCSICAKLGFLHLIVGKNQFRLLQGSQFLAEYRFNTGVAKHLFCRVCGIKSYYVPRSHPDGYSVNVRCLDGVSIGAVKLQPFDGLHWEEHAGELSDLSRTSPDLQIAQR